CARPFPGSAQLCRLFGRRPACRRGGWERTGLFFPHALARRLILRLLFVALPSLCQGGEGKESPQSGVPEPRRTAMSERRKMTRRGALQSGAGIALGGVLAASAAPAAGPAPEAASVYEALGVKHVINATGTVTFLGGSLMPPEVTAAWVEAAKHF